MISKIKKITPLLLKKYYWRYLKNKRKAEKKRIKFDGKTPKEAFTFIYKTNYWSGKDSISGGGSNLVHTKHIVESINTLIKDLELKSILDIPCGDFAWMQYVNFLDASYIGGDIVDELINDNINRYRSRDNVSFKVMDLVNDPLPKSDILINRDCLVHLSNRDIFKAIKNIKASGCKYLLTTTFTNHVVNSDIATGHWRALNLEEPPFNFPAPKKLINEQYKHPDYKDKSLALWELGNLQL